MNARAAIVAAIERQEAALAAQQASLAALRAALAALDGAQQARPPTTEWVETSIAAKLAGVSRETVRLWAIAHGSGRKTGAGKWQHDRARVLELAGRDVPRLQHLAGDLALLAVGGIPKQPDREHLVLEQEDDR